MSRLRVWMGKELREHRWALLGVGLAVAAITALPFVAFRAETTRSILDRLPAVAIALATLVLGLDLFARETRRSTHALILRTPGAMRWAFPAKLLLFALGVGGALAIEEGLRHTLEAATGVPYPYRYAFHEGEWRRFDRPQHPEFEFGVPIALYAGLVAAAVGLWHVAGSVASPRGGVGALCGVLALCLLSVPLVLLNAQHPWWFRPSPAETYAWIGGIGLVGLLSAGVAWYAGRRFLVPRKTAAVRGGLVAVVLAGLATGASAYAIDRWEAADPLAPQLVIHGGYLGVGGNRLFLTTSRGGMYGANEGWRTSGRQTPPFAWTIDLGDPAGTVADVRMGSIFTLPTGIVAGPALVPIPFVVRIDQELPHAVEFNQRFTWIDAARAEERVAGGQHTLTPLTIEASRATAKALTPLRDSMGRRVWWVEGVLERDGDEDRVPVPEPSARRATGVAAYVPTGIWVRGLARDARPIDARPQARVIDAETGESTWEPSFDWPVPPGFAPGEPSAWSEMRLTATKRLVRVSSYSPAGALEKDSGWLLWDVTGPNRFEPAPGAPVGHDAEPVGEGLLLTRSESGPERPEGGPAASRLVLWAPLTGERTPATSADAGLLAAARLNAIGTLPDGRRLISLGDRPRFQVGRQALALLDVPTRTLTPVAPWSAGGWHPIAFDVDGSLLVIEGNRRVVRLSEEGRRREVVWPK